MLNGMNCNGFSSRYHVKARLSAYKVKKNIKVKTHQIDHRILILKKITPPHKTKTNTECILNA